MMEYRRPQKSRSSTQQHTLQTCCKAVVISRGEETGLQKENSLPKQFPKQIKIQASVLNADFCFPSHINF
jgi:hypothetical protein